MFDRTERFIRWQAHMTTQMSVVLGLLGILSVGGLGLCFSLMQAPSFRPNGYYAIAFVLGLAALFVAAVAAIGATITRLLDFRLTKRKVRRGGAARPPRQFGSDAREYGRATWRLLWCALLSLGVAVLLLTFAVASPYLRDVLEQVEQ